MKRIGIVANYFGNPPPYFQLWLDSCARNATIDWLFFTDIPREHFAFPENVHYLASSLDALSARFQGAFPFPVRYNGAWDICAFRPVFGTVFKEELAPYDFWGWCDCDVLFGDLRSFFTEDRLEKFDKLLPKGHLSIVRNSDALNRAIWAHPLIEVALSSLREGLPCFDEVAFPREILPALNASQNNDIPFMNPRCRAGNFQLEEVSGVYNRLNVPEETYLHNIYTWREGELLGHYAQKSGDWSATLPIAYCHFFRRDMAVRLKRLGDATALIIPNVICPSPKSTFTAMEIRRYNRPKIHWSYFRKRLNLATLKRKLLG